MSSESGDTEYAKAATVSAPPMANPTTRLMSAYRRHMVKLMEKPTTASRASRSPVTDGPPTELDTITPIPAMVTAMATPICRVIRSPSMIQAHTAASSGNRGHDGHHVGHPALGDRDDEAELAAPGGGPYRQLLPPMAAKRLQWRAAVEPPRQHRVQRHRAARHPKGHVDTVGLRQPHPERIGGHGQDARTSQQPPQPPSIIGLVDNHVVGRKGLEPLTPCASCRCSSQLS